MDLGMFKFVTSVCCCITSVKSSTKNFAIAFTDESLRLQFLQFLIESSDIFNFVDYCHVHECSGTHDSQTKSSGMQCIINFTE